MSNKKMNGSVDILAKAMSQVFNEGLEKAVAPIRQDMAELRGDMKHLEEKMDKRFDTTDKNVQAQLAQNRENIAKDFKEAQKGA